MFAKWLACLKTTSLPWTGLCLSAALLLMTTWLPAEVPVEGKPASEPVKTADEPVEDLKGSEWPNLSLALQDSYLSTNLNDLDIKNDAWCLSQYAFGRVGRFSKEDSEAVKQQAIREFVDLPLSDIQAGMAKYASRNPQLARGTTNTIIIDIEAPVHPRNFWKLMGGPENDQITPLFSEVIQAFSRRYRVVRTMYPNATLTVYGMGMPDSQGRERQQEKARLNAEVMAARMGMLESVDAISPAIYERFGPTDRPYDLRDRATIQGMRHALQIVQASDRPLDIIVLMSLAIFNGNSDVTHKPADLEGLAERLELLAKLGVKRVIFWAGGETIAQTGIPVAQRLAQLRALEKQRQAKSPPAEPKPEKPAESNPG